MTGPFRHLHHVCIVVRDIDAATTYYERFGIGPWQQYRPLTEYGDLQVPNPDAFMKMKYRFVNVDNVQIQLCEPPQDDCPQRRFLDEKGEGVFHLGFESPLDEGVRQAESAGLQVLMQGRRADGTGFAYFDTLDDAGVVLMIRQSTPAAS